MKIVLINSFYFPDEPGGAEHSVRLLAEALVNKKHEVTVICLGGKRESAQLNGVRIERVAIQNKYLPNSLEHQPDRMARMMWHLRDIHNRSAANEVETLLGFIRPDVLHSNNLSGFSVSVWSVAKKLHIPVVHTTRDFYLLCPKTTMMRDGKSCRASCVSCKPFAYPRKLSSKHVNHVVGISKYVLNRHLENEYFPSAAQSIIYNSFDVDQVSYSEPKEEFRIGYIGRLVPEKGIELLIAAFAHLIKKNNYRVRLLIAGAGRDDYVKKLNFLSGGLPIDFLGEKKPSDFFNSIDLTVVPSVWNEPLGRVVIESMAFGKPVVATPMGGIPELIDSGFGVLSNDLSVSSLVDAICSMLIRMRSDHQSMYAAAMLSAEKFSGKVVATSYENVYQQII